MIRIAGYLAENSEGRFVGRGGALLSSGERVLWQDEEEARRAAEKVLHLELLLAEDEKEIERLSDNYVLCSNTSEALHLYGVRYWGQIGVTDRCAFIIGSGYNTFSDLPTVRHAQQEFVRQAQEGVYIGSLQINPV